MLPADYDSARGDQATHRSLWHNRNFLKLWAGHTISMFGSQITPLALPLIASVTLQATPAQMALLTAIGYAPATLVGLLAGVWVDRLRRRPLMIATDLARSLVLVALPLAALFDAVRIELLYAVAFLLSFLGLFHGTADAAFLPALVRREQLVEANSKLAASSSVARIGGPGLAGMLVQWLTAPFAVLVDVLTFVFSALCVGLIRAPEPPRSRPERRRRIWFEIGEGLLLIVRDPYLRAFALSSAALDIFWNALYAVYFIYVTRELGLLPSAIGVIFSLGSVGALLGSLLVGRMTRRLGIGSTVIGAQIAVGAGSLLIALAMWLPSVALLLLIMAEFLQSCTGTIYGVNRDSLRQSLPPDRLRGGSTLALDSSVCFRHWPGRCWAERSANGSACRPRSSSAPAAVSSRSCGCCCRRCAACAQCRQKNCRFTQRVPDFGLGFVRA